jgi:hypothetical protein
MSDDSGGLTRRTVLAGAGGLAAAGIVPPAAGAAKAARRLGEPRDGTAAAEVFGQVAQDGTALTGYGYLTRLSGLKDAALFTGSAQTEATARLMFTSEAQLRARFLHGKLVAVVGTGTLRFHLANGGGNFATPGTFGGGTVVATFSARFQNVLTVIGPDQAVTTIEGELVQRQAKAFTFGGRRDQIGHRGLRRHLSANGPGARTDPTVPRAVFDVAGRIVVAR